MEADRQSRLPDSPLKWTLDNTVFKGCISELSVLLTIDLFASRISHQLPNYVSWCPDPGAVAIDAFHLSWKEFVSYIFPPFSLMSRVLQKIQQEKVEGVIVVLKWPIQTWWPMLMQMLTDNPILLPNRKNTADSSWKPSKDSPPPISQTRIVDVPLVRRSLESQEISAKASRLIIQSWRSDTASQNQNYYKKWGLFCRQQNINPLQATLQDGINFLEELFATGVGYSCLNTAHSALSSLIVLPGSIQFGSHLLETRFVKGVFEVWPALPRYKDIWNVNKVLKILAAWTLGEGLSLKSLSRKLTMLLALLSGQRVQILNALTLSSMTLSETKCLFTIGTPLKTTDQVTTFSPLIF